LVQKISISNKHCYFDHCIHQRTLEKMYHGFPKLIRLISEGSCGIED